MRKKAGREKQKHHPPRLLSCLQLLGRAFRTRESGMDLRRGTDSTEGLYQETDSFNATLERQARPGGKANGKAQAKSKMFVKSLSVEPSGATLAEHESVVMRKKDGERKKTLTTFWSNLFGTKIPENRNSGISIQSASYESVNTILSSNSFSFVNPKKYKGKAQKGKRIPIAEPQAEDLSKPRRKMGTLTRLGIKMGLKSKYNLQSCESLQCLSQLEASETSARSQTGTLNSTFRRKKQAAPPPPKELSSTVLPPAQSTLPNPSNVPHCSKIVPVETHPAPNNNKGGHHHLQQHLDANVNNSSAVKPEERPGTSGAKNPPGQTHSQEDFQEPFKIGIRHKRSVSEGYSAPTLSTSSHMTNHSASHTLTNTFNRSKTHVRGKRRAPAPPNPFGDPDAPEESPILPLQQTQQETDNTRKSQSSHLLLPASSNLSSKRNFTPVPSLNPFEIPESEEPEVTHSLHPTALALIIAREQIPTPVISTQQSVQQARQVQIENHQVPLSTNSAAVLEDTSQEDEEIVQNLLNARYEEETYQQDQLPLGELTDVPASSSNQNTANDENMAKSRKKGDQASKNSSESLRSVTKDRGGPSGGKKTNLGDICISASNYSFTDRNQGSPATPPASPQFLSGDAVPGVSSGSTSPCLFSSLSVSSTTSSTNSSSPSKLTPRPWYKRATNSALQSKKSKPLITPVPGMTKFSDIDREAARIVAENRRRSAELESSESAKELINMFNAFNKSQRSPVRGLNSISDTATDSETSTLPAPGSSERSTPATSSELSPSAQKNIPQSSQGQSQKSESKLLLTTATSATSSNSNGYNGKDNMPTTASVPLPDSQPQKPTTNVLVSPITEESSSKKLAVVQPQSNNRTKLSEDRAFVVGSAGLSAKVTTSAIVTPAIKKVEVTVNGTEDKQSKSTNPITASYVSTAKDWICPRCTLSNNQWRLTCEACYYKKYSSIQKPLPQAASSSVPTDSTTTYGSKQTKTQAAAGNSASGPTASRGMTKPDAAPCENFMSQIPAKETHERDEKLSGIKLTDDPNDESFDITRVREARLAFFNKAGGSVEAEDTTADTFTPVKTKANDLTTNNPPSSEISEQANHTGDKSVNKPMNVFSDNEDDSIDNLLQIPPFLIKPNGNSFHWGPNEIGACGNQAPPEPPFGTMQEMPNFLDNSGSRTLNPFHLHRFRPMLESILESSTDMYLGLDHVYQNWNFENGFPPSPFPPPQIRNAKSLGASGRKQKQKSGKYQVVIGKDGKLLPLPFASPPKTQVPQHIPPPNESSSTSNSDSSDYSYQNKRLHRTTKQSMKNNNQESTYANQRSRQQVMFQSPIPEKLSIEEKLTLEEYRKLGAIPKNFKAHGEEKDKFTGDSYEPYTSSNERKQRRPPKHQNMQVSETDSGSDSSRSYFDTVAVTKLLKQLEHAIAKGDQNKAANLAHDLALLKVECVVSKGSSNPKDVTIFVYVEDRFIQQGPFEVEVSPYMTVRELKEKIENDWNIPIPFQKWILVNRPADDDKEMLINFSLGQNSLVYLYLVTPQVDTLPESGCTEEIQSIPRSMNRHSISRKHDETVSDSGKFSSDNEFSSECSNLGASSRYSHNSDKEFKCKRQVKTDISTVNSSTNTDFAMEKSLEDPTCTSGNSGKSSASSSCRSKISRDQSTQSVFTETKENTLGSLKSKKSAESQLSPEITKSLNHKALDQRDSASKVTLPQEIFQLMDQDSSRDQVELSKTTTVPSICRDKNHISTGASATFKDHLPEASLETHAFSKETNRFTSKKSETSHQQTQVTVALNRKSLTLQDEASNSFVSKKNSYQKSAPDSNEKRTSPRKPLHSDSFPAESELSVPVPKRRIKKKREEINKEIGSKSVELKREDSIDRIEEKRKQVKHQDSQTFTEIIKGFPTNGTTNPQDSESCRESSIQENHLPSLSASDPQQLRKVLRSTKDRQSPSSNDDPPPLPQKGPQLFTASCNDDFRVPNPIIAPASTAALVLSGEVNNRATYIPKSNSSAGREEKEDNVQTYLKMMQKMEAADGFSMNFKECHCSTCFTKVKPKEGVILQNCSHSFCRKCLARKIRANNDSSPIRCPFREKGSFCPATINVNEITSLLQITTTSLPRR